MPKILSVSIASDLNIGPKKFFERIMVAINPVIKEMEEELIRYMEDDESDFNKQGRRQIQFRWDITPKFDLTKDRNR